jgi:hypothetical protein
VNLLQNLPVDFSKIPLSTPTYSQVVFSFGLSTKILQVFFFFAACDTCPVHLMLFLFDVIIPNGRRSNCAAAVAMIGAVL